MSRTTFVALCLAPLLIVSGAFFVLPLARLVLVGASGPDGASAYLAILTGPRYRDSLVATLILSVATTAATLAIATVVGLFLQRNAFPGRSVLVAMLTFPLAFPGVVVGFMIILLAGRQGLLSDIARTLTGQRLVLAYSVSGLFLGYLYFSIPRVILTIMASVEKLDPQLEEAARALGAGPWAVHRDVHPARADASLHRVRGDLLRNRDGRLRDSLHAGGPHRRPSDGDLHGVHPQREHRDGGRALGRARARDLGGARGGAILRWLVRRGGGLTGWPATPSRSQPRSPSPGWWRLSWSYRPRCRSWPASP